MEVLLPRRPGVARAARGRRPRAGERGDPARRRSGVDRASAEDVDLRLAREDFDELAARVFGLRYGLPGKAVAVVAYVEGEPVSGGRVDFEDGVDFAGLYGGITLPEFRGRGLYRATVAKRAELARERGYRWLYSDALPTSRPILERLGFVPLTTTTPFVIPAATG